MSTASDANQEADPWSAARPLATPSAHFDVFLSHHSADKPVVEAIARALQDKGLVPWLDAWELTPGGDWQAELAAGLRASRACAVFVGPHGAGAWSGMEARLALDLAAKDPAFHVFPVLLPGVAEPFDPATLPPFLAAYSWVDLRGGLDGEVRLSHLVRAILGQAGGDADVPGRTVASQPEPAAADPVTAAPSQPAYGGFLGAVPLGPLVGRGVEMDRLLAVLDAVGSGLGRVALLAGEPGVGKTRLAQELMRQAGERGFRVLAGRCYEQYASLPFYPFVEALTAAMAVASPALRLEVPRRFAYLGRLLPDLVASPPVRDGEDVRLRIWYAVGGFLAALGAEAPLAVVLDDLHWADSASLELLLYLARRAAGDRVLLVGTYRDIEVNRQHPLEAALGELVRERLVEEVSLRGLSPAGTAALVGAHFGLEEVSAELRDLLHARTEGNPFFIEEVLKALVEQGAIFRSGEGWDRAAIGEIDVPRSIRSVVGRRVGRLALEAQEVLRVASVLGQEWDLELLLGAVDLEQEAVLRHVEAALEARLLEERRLGRRERYTFSHALIGQSLYEEVPRFRLRKLHLRAGEALERIHGEQPEAWAELARHFLAAGEEERATRYAILAGDHAASLYTHAEAIRQYEAALELLDEADNTLDRVRIWEKLGVELRVLGRYEAALAYLELAAQTWHAAGELESLGRVARQIGWVHVASGAPEEGIQRIQSLLLELEGLGPSPTLAALYETLAWALWQSGQYTQALPAAEQAAVVAQILGDTRMVARANLLHGNVLTLLGRFKEGLDATEAAIPPAEATKDLESLSCALANLAYICFYRGDLHRGRPFAERAVATGDQLGDPLWLTWALCVRGQMYLYLGDWSRARGDTEQALAVSAQAGGWAVPFALQAIGQLCAAEGRWDEARRHLEEAFVHASPSGDLQLVRWAARSLAELEIRQGCAPAACARLVPLLDRPGLAEFDVTAFLPTLAWAYLTSGHLAQAEHTVEQALGRARAEQLRLVLVDALRVQAMVVARQEQWQEAEQALEEGLTFARSMPYPYAEARLLHLSGRLRTQAGNPVTARERLATALAIFRRLGARKDIEQVERDLAACATEG
jgi:tetratricopeptide (TPR) repeat protein